MAYGVTLTLPTITGSHTDFPVLLKEADFPTGAIDGGANSIDNGGGNLRAYTTSAKTTQLPLEVVSFVAGGTPAAEVYVKIPTAATSNTIFIEADAVETAQPAVTATYGRNAVWADYELVAHLDEAANTTSGGYTDSTGNNDGTGISMDLALVAGPFGGDVAKFDGSNDRIEFPISLGATDDIFTIQGYAKPDDLTVDQRLFSLLGAGSDASAEVLWMDADGSGDGWRAQTKESSTTTHTIGADSDNNASTAWQLLHHTYGSSASALYKDGSSVASGSAGADFSDGAGDADTFIVANLWQLTGAGAYFDGAIAALRLRMSDLSANWIATEHDNMSASANWVAVGAWADAGGAGAALAGDAAGQATAAAEATTGIPIAGAMLSVATSNGVISTGIDMTGAMSAIALGGGDIDTEIRVSVAAIIEALAQAGLDAQTLLEAAAAAGQADASGTLSGDGAALSAAAQAIADGNATITIAITMQGDALAEALAQAGLTAPGSGLAGDASAVADALAVMLTQINMIGGGSAVVTTLGGIDTILQMQGAAAAASNTLGGLTAQVQFNAQAFVQALVQAGLTTAGGGLEGDAGAVADASGWLKIKVQFDGAAVGVAVALGNLTTGAIDIPKIARWTVTAEKRNWTVEDKRSWEVCA